LALDGNLLSLEVQSKGMQLIATERDATTGKLVVTNFVHNTPRKYRDEMLFVASALPSPLPELPPELATEVREGSELRTVEK
jgi:hypothetical protein